MLTKQKMNLIFDSRFLIPLIFYFLTFFNSALLAGWMISYLLMVLIVQDERIAVQFFIFVQLRSLISTGVAVSIASVSIIKWICVFGISLLVIFRCYSQTNQKLKSLILLLCLFSAYSILSSLLVSSYPLVAIFKVLSYVIPFVAVILSVYKTRDCCWIHEINLLLGLTILGGIIVLPLPVGYLRNGRFFQGLFNHPNILGVMVAIYLAGYIYENNRRIRFSSLVIVVLFNSFMIYKSYSRTGMLSFVLVLIIGILFLNIPKKQKMSIIVCSLVGFSLISIFSDTWRNEIVSYFLKGQHSIYDITYSRQGQIENNLNRIKMSPFLGTGFNVPYHLDIRDFSFSFDLITENGNLVMALLGDVGIIGTTLFTICYAKVFSIGRGNINGYTIFIVPFLVSMGEMAFFSTNNFAIILYLYFAIFMADKLKSSSNNDVYQS